MTKEEADKIAAVIRTADNGCSQCVRDLCDRMSRAELGFAFTVYGEESVTEQPDWSDDADDAISHFWPIVVVTQGRPPPR